MTVVCFRILHHFNTTADHYSVIFTSGCTASLKLVAEHFVFHDDITARNHGNFVYLDDNHTSVVGMREVLQQGTAIKCVSATDVTSILKDGQQENNNNDCQEGAEGCRNLFAYPAQSNFNGHRYPLSWIPDIQKHGIGYHGNTYILLDAAAYVTTAVLDLSRVQPDFVTLSFYKMFGFPTGLGKIIRF